MTKKDKIFLEWLEGTRTKKIEPNRTLWYRKSQRHREDGPAVEWVDGAKQWWINGKKQ